MRVSKRKFGLFVINKREEKNISREELAKRLCISYQVVYRWETGVRFPDYEMIGLLASELGVSVQELYDNSLVEDNHKVMRTFLPIILIVAFIGISILVLMHGGKGREQQGNLATNNNAVDDIEDENNIEHTQNNNFVGSFNIAAKINDDGTVTVYSEQEYIINCKAKSIYIDDVTLYVINEQGKVEIYYLSEDSAVICNMEMLLEREKELSNYQNVGITTYNGYELAKFLLGLENVSELYIDRSNTRAYAVTEAGIKLFMWDDNIINKLGAENIAQISTGGIDMYLLKDGKVFDASGAMIDGWDNILSISAAKFGLTKDGKVLSIGKHHDDVDKWSDIKNIAACNNELQMVILGLTNEGRVMVDGNVSKNTKDIVSSFRDVDAVYVNYGYIYILKENGEVSKLKWK